MLWLLESGLVAIARLLLYLRLLGQVTNLFPQLTRRLSAGEPHARVRGPCAQFGGMGLEHVQQPLPVALVVPDALVVAKHALVGEDAAQPDDQMGAPLARLGVLPSHDALFARPELLHPALDVGAMAESAAGFEGGDERAKEHIARLVQLGSLVEAMCSTDVMGNYTSREDLRATVAKALEHNVRTSDGMNWNLQDLVYEALSEEWRKRDGEDDDPWENHGPDGYQPPSYEPVNPERRTAQTPSDGLI